VSADANPAGVPPGHFSSESLTIIEDTMNATIRECVFVTEFLDAGDTDSAFDSLTQIALNAEQTLARVQDALKVGATP
jgi:hypothetical protein